MLAINLKKGKNITKHKVAIKSRKKQKPINTGQVIEIFKFTYGSTSQKIRVLIEIKFTDV